jgi:hypothetical protein
MSSPSGTDPSSASENKLAKIIIKQLGHCFDSQHNTWSTIIQWSHFCPGLVFLSSRSRRASYFSSFFFFTFHINISIRGRDLLRYVLLTSSSPLAHFLPFSTAVSFLVLLPAPPWSSSTVFLFRTSIMYGIFPPTKLMWVWNFIIFQAACLLMFCWQYSSS